MGGPFDGARGLRLGISSLQFVSEERTYDADNNLKQLRVRQDAGLIKGLMMSVDEEFAPDRGKGSGNVVIIVERPKEGGWGNEDDPPTEIQTVEVSSVDEEA